MRVRKFVGGLSLLALIWVPTSCGHRRVSERALNPLARVGVVRVVAAGFKSTEGPVWHPASNALLFTDIPGNTIYALDTTSGDLKSIRTPSNTSNGLALDRDGYLLAAEQQSRTISSMNLATREVRPFVTKFFHQGAPRSFNSPNDMAVSANGAVYFTDPPFGLRGRTRELEFNGLFLRHPDGTIKLLKALAVDQKPNGVALNPQQTILYVAISHDESGPVLAYDVDRGGNLSNERVFARAQNADGMTVDSRGNLYVATRTGVRVWAADGREWGWIRLPGNLRTTNVAFAGKAMTTLYITNRSSKLYAVDLNVKGHR